MQPEETNIGRSASWSRVFSISLAALATFALLFRPTIYWDSGERGLVLSPTPNLPNGFVIEVGGKSGFSAGLESRKFAPGWSPLPSLRHW